jgi:hypothetical protein
LFYTFVGTPEDQNRWSLEYIDKYIKPNLKMAGIDIKPEEIKLTDKITLKMKGGNLPKKLISKHQYGTNRGGLVHHQESGTWGNRG